MLAEATVISFVPCHSLDEAERFYGGTLGLQKKSRDEFSLVFSTPGSTLYCVHVAKFTPQEFTVVGWEVPDLPAAAAALAAVGIRPLRYPYFEQDEAGIWSAPDGDQVLWFNDPFGNNLSLSHHRS